MRPAAYIFSSTSTVSGKKSRFSLRMLRRDGRGEDDGVLVEDDEGGPGRLTRETAGLKPDFAYAKLAVIDNGFSAFHTLHTGETSLR